MNTCKDCIYFDNSKPIATIYIGKCEKLHLPLQLNDSCCLFKSKSELVCAHNMYYERYELKCNKKHCEGCESFNYTSSVLDPGKLHIRCNKTNQFRVVDLEHTVKPEDFYEEEK